MTLLHHFTSTAQRTKYEKTLTGEKLGWVIQRSPKVFSPVHLVLCDPLVGPVIMLDDEAWELDPDTTDVFETRAEALAAYFTAAVSEQSDLIMERPFDPREPDAKSPCCDDGCTIWMNVGHQIVYQCKACEKLAIWVELTSEPKRAIIWS